MRAIRAITFSILAIGLLAGSAVLVAAQDEESPEPLVSPSPLPLDAEPMPSPAPVARFLPREIAGEQLVVGNLSPQEIVDRFGGGGDREALRDLLLPYGKVPSDMLVAFGRNDRSILMYAMRVEGIASDGLAGVVIEAQKGNLPPTVSLTTETIGERTVTVVRDTDGSEAFGAIFYPTDEVLFLITVPDEMSASVAMEDVLAELP